MRLAWGELSRVQDAGRPSAETAERLPQMTGTAKLGFRRPLTGAFREKGVGKAEATREEAVAITQKRAESQS